MKFNSLCIDYRGKFYSIDNPFCKIFIYIVFQVNEKFSEIFQLT